MVKLIARNLHRSSLEASSRHIIKSLDNRAILIVFRDFLKSAWRWRENFESGKSVAGWFTNVCPSGKTPPSSVLISRPSF